MEWNGNGNGVGSWELGAGCYVLGSFSSGAGHFNCYCCLGPLSNCAAMSMGMCAVASRFSVDKVEKLIIRNHTHTQRHIPRKHFAWAEIWYACTWQIQSQLCNLQFMMRQPLAKWLKASAAAGNGHRRRIGSASRPVSWSVSRLI